MALNWPATQSVHVLAPALAPAPATPSLNCPAAQLSHELSAPVSWYLPSGQCSHEVWPRVCWNLPVSQLLQLLAVVRWYLPAGQEVHAAWPSRANLPSAHTTQAPRPVTAANLPTAQSLQ